MPDLIVLEIGNWGDMNQAKMVGYAPTLSELTMLLLTVNGTIVCGFHPPKTAPVQKTRTYFSEEKKERKK